MKRFSLLTANTTILTPNRRLSATIKKKFDAYNRSLEKNSWQTLDTLPLQSFVLRLWQNINLESLSNDLIILTPEKESLIWENIILKSPENDRLLQISKSADLAKSAWQLLQQWQIPLSHPMLDYTEDCKTFKRWASVFKNICTEKHLIDTSSLANIVQDKISKTTLGKIDNIILTGFTELTPQQHSLINKLKQLGIKVELIDVFFANETTKANVISLNDFDNEVKTMAKWAKKTLAEQPDKIIGCVVPELETHREKVLQTFSEVFADNTNKFNISAGKPLTKFAIVNAALKILSLNLNKLSHEDLHFLLNTPFIKGAEVEKNQRAKFFNQIIATNQKIFSIDHLTSSELKLSLNNYSPILSKVLKEIKKFSEKLESKALCNTWIDHFSKILKLIGWPGEKLLNSEEYQVVNRFLDFLNEFKSYNNIIDKISKIQTHKTLQKICSKVIFQAKTNDSQIQILGLLEAAGLPFDNTWVIGLDDSKWPNQAKPNPLLPVKFQKELKMPHSSAERELNYSIKLTSQLKSCTEHIIFSHSEKDGDTELRPSTLISNNNKLKLENLSLPFHKSMIEELFASKSIENFVDETAPEVSNDEKLKGGVSILKNQALCPFKAFATIRLNANEINNIYLGLKPTEKGIIVHKILELIWHEIKDSRTLKALSDEKLKELINKNIDKAIDDSIQINIYQSKYLKIENLRLSKIIYKWLQLEKQREDFSVVSIESETKFTINEFEFKIRVDRIDETNNGDKIIIDYKTKKFSNPKLWFSDRPEEPQLPLYCLTDPDKTKAIAFGEINSENISLTGVTDNFDTFSKLKPIAKNKFADNDVWQLQINSWQNNLENLTANFINGNAKANPKNINETCLHCKIKPVCRILEHED